MSPRRLCIIALLLFLSACVRPAPTLLPNTPGSYWATGQLPTPQPITTTPTLSYVLPTQRPPGAPLITPTPDALHYSSTPERGPETYVVQSGDMLSAIAVKHGVSLDAIMQANGITDPNMLEVGQVLNIPVVTPQPPGPPDKIIPDSELIYGPNSRLDVAAFIKVQGGYLASFTQAVNDETLTGAQIVQRVAANYSVNPRLLLAVLEYRSGWVTNPSPDPALSETPFGFSDNWYTGFYRQLVWAAVALNTGYYRWRGGDVTDWVLGDGSVVPIDPTINAGTAGVQFFFAQLDGYTAWLRDVSAGGFIETYSRLFDYPFDYAVEPLIPTNLIQPLLHLPFAAGETWYFTGGPHDAWDVGTPLGALDFAAPDTEGCNPLDDWVTAMADGLVVRSETSTVVEDLDLDGLEQTGWVVEYFHIENRGRVPAGTMLKAGDHIGHPSCEGGIYSAAHVHVIRKFNGEWLSAYGRVPFVLDGWVADGTGEEYVGTLTRNGEVVVPLDGGEPSNQIHR